MARDPISWILEILVALGAMLVVAGAGFGVLTTSSVSLVDLPDAHLVVNGSIQAGLLNGTRSVSSFRLKLIGPSHITYDEELLNKALQGLGRIVDVNLDFTARKKILGYAQRGWRTRPSG